MAPCSLENPLKCSERSDATVMPKNSASSSITSTIIGTLKMPACPLMISTSFNNLEWPKKPSRPLVLMTSLNKPENTKSSPLMKASSSLKLLNSPKNLPIKVKSSSLPHLTEHSRERLSETLSTFFPLPKRSSNYPLFASIAQKKQLSLWEPSTPRKSSWLEARSHTSQCAESVISHNSNQLKKRKVSGKLSR